MKPIVEDVRKRGDAAVAEYTKKFDGVTVDPVCVKVDVRSPRISFPARPPARHLSSLPPSTSAQDLPMPDLDPEVKKAFDVAYANISAFHAAQQQPDSEVETMPGVRCRRVTRPIGAVGLYVPGGSAVLPSTALMLAIPAKIAKCEVGAWVVDPRLPSQFHTQSSASAATIPHEHV